MGKSSIKIGAVKVSGTNTGAGVGLYAGSNPFNNFNFKSLVAAGSIDIISGTTTITISGGSGGGSTSPAGADRYIQFNDSGSFGASSGLTYSTGGTLSVATDFAIDGTSLFREGTGAAGSLEIGTAALSVGVNTIALGSYACATNGCSIAIGRNARAATSFQSAIAIGSYAVATCEGSISIGYEAGTGFGAVKNSSISIGKEANRNTDMGDTSIAIGWSAKSYGNGSIAIGTYGARSFCDCSITIGTNARSCAENSIAIGKNAAVAPDTAIGSVVIGHFNKIQGAITGATVIGGVCRTITDTGLTNHVIVNNLAIEDVPTSGSSDQVLIRNITNGIVEYVSKASLGGGGGGGLSTANNGLTANGTNVQLGGTLTGNTNIDTGDYSFAMGNTAVATGVNSFAFGCLSNASGRNSIGLGYQACPAACNSIVVGGEDNVIESGNTSAAIIGGINITLAGTGYTETVAVPNFAMICIPVNNASTDQVLVRSTSTGIIGYVSKASLGGGGSVGNGLSISGSTIVLGGTLTGNTVINGNENAYSMTFEETDVIIGGSLDVGYSITTSGDYSVATGWYSEAIGDNSFAIGYCSCAIGDNSLANGYKTQAIGIHSFATGCDTCAVGVQSHAEGDHTFACGVASHAEGESTYAIGGNSHAQGKYGKAYGNYSHVEGYFTRTTASANYAHAEGRYTCAANDGVHTGGFGYDTSYFIYACGNGAFNHSYNSTGQTTGHGALANWSAILGGRNHNIEVLNSGATIIGGTGIKLTGTSYVNTTAVDNFAIITTPTTNNTTDEVLVRNTSTGVIDTVSKASLGGGGSGGCYPNTLWVSVSGNNSTAVAGDMTKPFLTFACALTEADALSPTVNNRALVCVSTGFYPNQTINTCNHVDWHLDHGTYICGTNAAINFNTVNSNLYGYGCFRLNDGTTGVAVSLFKATGNTHFHTAHKCSTNGGALQVTCSIQNSLTFDTLYNGCNSGALIFGADIVGSKVNMCGNYIKTYGGSGIRTEDTGSVDTNGYMRVREIIATGTSLAGFYHSSEGKLNICTDIICSQGSGIVSGTAAGCWAWGGQIKADSSSPINFIGVGSTPSIRGGSVLENAGGTISITSGSAQTVKVLGHVVATCAVSGNITTSVGTFTVDSTVEVV